MNFQKRVRPTLSLSLDKTALLTQFKPSKSVMWPGFLQRCNINKNELEGQVADKKFSASVFVWPSYITSGAGGFYSSFGG